QVALQTTKGASTSLIDGDWQYFADPKWKKAENIGVSLESDDDRVFVLRRSPSSSFSIVVLKRDGENVIEFKLDGVKSAHSVHYHGRSGEKTASLWVTDKESGALVEYTLGGKMIRTITEVYRKDSGEKLTFGRVTSLAWDRDGHMFLADGDRDGKYNRVMKLDLRDEQECVVDIWGGEEPGNGEKEFNLPHALVVDEYDNVWIADALNHRIQVISSSGDFIAQKDLDHSFEVYGIDICKTAQNSGMAFVTMCKLGKANQLWLFPVKMDKNTIEFGDTLKHWDIPSEPKAFVHGVLVDPSTREIYFLSTSGPTLHPKCKPATPKLERIGVFIVPEFPNRFRATAIMHPFDASQLVIAEILYDYPEKMMLFDCFGMNNGHFKFIISRDKCYVQDSEMKDARLVKKMNKVWELPPPYWFKLLSPNYVGKQSIHGVETIWWRYAPPDFKKTQSPARSSHEDHSRSVPLITELFQSDPQQGNRNNWFWFDNAGHLLRVMFTNPRNMVKFPVLGDFAMIHLPVFEVLSNTKFPTKLSDSPLKKHQYLDESNHLKNVAELLKNSSRETLQDDIDRIIPGLRKYSDKLDELPQWPNKLYMTAYMTPVQYTEPFPTQILYDYDLKKQRTRLFQTDNTDSVIDVILDKEKAYQVQRFSNGDIKCHKSIPCIGIVVPDWLKKSKAKIAGVLEKNPKFGPEKTILIMSCPITSMLVHSEAGISMRRAIKESY
ncbi:hypothetical protein BC937DRAFT_88337, partial [Endogone sp. FLAS-F59071]